MIQFISNFREDLEQESKKKNKWLDNDDEESCGFAIGRRIFEKAEIEVDWWWYLLENFLILIAPTYVG